MTERLYRAEPQTLTGLVWLGPERAQGFGVPDKSHGNEYICIWNQEADPEPVQRSPGDGADSNFEKFNTAKIFPESAIAGIFFGSRAPWDSGTHGIRVALWMQMVCGWLSARGPRCVWRMNGRQFARPGRSCADTRTMRRVKQLRSETLLEIARVKTPVLMSAAGRSRGSILLTDESLNFHPTRGPAWLSFLREYELTHENLILMGV